MNSSQSIFLQVFLSAIHLQIDLFLHSDSEEILIQLNPEDDAPPETSISSSSDNVLIFVSISVIVYRPPRSHLEVDEFHLQLAF